MRQSQPPTHAKLLHVVHLVCSDIRRCAGAAPAQQIYDMADAIEFVPQVLMNWREEAWPVIRAVLAELQRKYPGLGEAYTRVLDMDDAEFLHVHAPAPPDTTDPDYQAYVNPPPN